MDFSHLVDVLKGFERPIEITQESVNFAFKKLPEDQQMIIKARFIDSDGELLDGHERFDIGKKLGISGHLVRAKEIKGLRKMLDLIPQYDFNKENVIEYLKNHTKHETIAKFKVTKKVFDTFIKDNNIEILYERRTEITNGLIPCKHAINKITGKKREKYNAGLQINKENEVKIRNNIKKESEFKLGCLLAQNADIVEQINSLMQKISYQKSLIECLFKCDPVSYLEEEAFGCHTNVDDMKTILTNDMILGYVSQKYGVQKAVIVDSVLKESSNEQI